MVILLAANTPTLILNPNSRRRLLVVQLQKAAVDPNNSGNVFVGRGFQPTGTVGAPTQGLILRQSDFIREEKSWTQDTLPYKGAVWVRSDTANQTIIVEEEVELEGTP